MKTVLPLLALAIFFTSCSTAYKTGQTPDDVYYSPERPTYASSRNDYVQMDKENDRQYRGTRRNDYRDDYYYDDGYYNDRYLRMKVRNRRVWSDLDFYYSDPFAYRYYRPNYFSSYWSPYSAWNSYSYWNYYYNPYYSHFYNPYYYHGNPYYRGHYYGGHYGNVIIVNPRSPVYSRPRTSNLRVYSTSQNPVNTRGRQGYNSSSAPVYSTPSSSSSPSRRQRDVGSEMRNTFGNSSNNNNPSYSPPSRPSSPSTPSNSGSSGSSGSSGNSGGGGGQAPARRF